MWGKEKSGNVLFGAAVQIPSQCTGLPVEREVHCARRPARRNTRSYLLGEAGGSLILLLTGCHYITRQSRYPPQTDTAVDVLSCAFHAPWFPHRSALTEMSRQKEVGPFFRERSVNIRESKKKKHTKDEAEDDYIRKARMHGAEGFARVSVPCSLNVQKKEFLP